MTHYENYSKIIEMIDEKSTHTNPVDKNGHYLVAIGGFIAILCDIMEDIKNDKKTTV